jgi:hypothetical protein
LSGAHVSLLLAESTHLIGILWISLARGVSSTGSPRKKTPFAQDGSFPFKDRLPLVGCGMAQLNAN